MSQTLASYIPVAVFLAVIALLVWSGVNRAARLRAEAEARADARIETQTKDLNRSSEAIERIAAALEARNQIETAKSNPAAADSKTGH
jgi:hypothetical protein